MFLETMKSKRYNIMEAGRHTSQTKTIITIISMRRPRYVPSSSKWNKKCNDINTRLAAVATTSSRAGDHDMSRQRLIHSPTVWSVIMCSLSFVTFTPDETD